MEDENMEHFLLHCRKLEDKRDPQLIRKFWNEDKLVMIGEMLFDNNETEGVKKMLNNMWQKRSVELKKNKERIQNIRNTTLEGTR